MKITCTVTVGGIPVGDSLDDLKGGHAVALEGLSIQWGRRTRLDQPQASSCSMSVMLPPGPPDLTRFLPGNPVKVLATHDSASPETSTVIHHPSAQPLTTTPTLFTPAATVPHGQTPAAWDTRPRIEVGATYSITLTAKLPPYSTLHVRPAYYTAPHSDTYTTGPDLVAPTQSNTITAAFTPSPEYAGRWLGLALHVSPLGASIAATPTAINSTHESLDELTAASVQNISVTRTSTTHSRATVFSGRISDSSIEYDRATRRARVDLTALDFSVELANTLVGDQPWPLEPAVSRARRILAAAGNNAPVVSHPGPAALDLQRRDVDNQPALSLLTAVATSTGAILWPAYHDTIGDYLFLEDPAARVSLYQLTFDASGNTTLSPAPWNTLRLPASTLFRDGIALSHDTTDLATSVTVKWTQDSVNDKGEPTLTTHEETTHDIDRRRIHGHQLLTVTTDLTRKNDAHALAQKLITHTAPGSWTLPHATWDTRNPGTTPTAVIATLDATRRIGLPISLTGVDEWVPGAPTIPVYLDGGKYTYKQGRWVMDMTFTRSTLADSLTINQATALTIDKTPQTLDEMAAATI